MFAEVNVAEVRKIQDAYNKAETVENKIVGKIYKNLEDKRTIM